MKFEPFNEEKYRPCLVDDLTGLFHMWTINGKAIVEFDDGTVLKVEAEDIRFLDTERLMAENACFSDEFIESFKKTPKNDKITQFESYRALQEWDAKWLGEDGKEAE